MKQLTVLLFCCLMIFFSCKKELSCENCTGNTPPVNKSPIANAGADQTLTLPKDSVTLNGSASTDPDGIITAYSWRKISGPSSAIILKADSVKTSVKGLVTGVYQFELKVTDDKVAIARDTVQVLVDNPAVNQPPVACAGADQTITLPKNSVSLDGSCSADPENNITAYNWIKISGPASFIIANTGAAQTQVINLVEGVYLFEIKVTDAGGLSSRDTVQITVSPASPLSVCTPISRPVVNIPLLPFASIPFPRNSITAATAGSKLLLAGGRMQLGGSQTSRVDIYDFNTQSWSVANLSMPRAVMTSATVGDKIFFVGGEVPGFVGTKRIDIYNASTNTWDTATLSIRTHDVSIAAVGNKVFFSHKTVDVYDMATNSWTVKTLPMPRLGATATAVGNKVYFAGGNEQTNALNYALTATVDVYDTVTDTWSTSASLNQPTIYMASIYQGGKIYWGGGTIGWDQVNDVDINTCKVEVRDVTTQNTSFFNLSQPWSFSLGGQNAVYYNSKILFWSAYGFEIYDPLNNTLGIGKFPPNIFVESTILINNILYGIGCDAGGGSGSFSDRIWKMQF